MWRGERRIRLLMVDDEDGFRQTLARRLEKRGLVVTQAGGGEAALAALEAESADVVLLDVKMPGMDGLTVLARIKDEYPDTEVILVTGQASTHDGVEGIKAGAFDYLTKPVELEQLVGKIRQAFERILRLEEQAKEEQYRAKLEQQLIATERLASLGTLSAGVAHEINNPLAIISEAAGWLKSRAAAEEALGESFRKTLDLAVSKIESNVNRAKRITHQLLGFARQTDSYVHEFDLGDLVREVVELTQKTVDETGAELTTAVNTEQTKLWGDVFQIRQVLINLVNNGLQAVGRGGRVEMAVSTTESQVVIAVIDNGPGIPPENLDRIFEPFFTTKAPGQGTGLGLSLSRGLIEKLGGEIEVSSRLGQGTVFTVRLPRTCPYDGQEPVGTREDKRG